MCERIRYLVVGLCAVFMVAAGLLKVTDLPMFIASLQGWSIVPGWAVTLLGFGVVLIELVLGMLWLVGVNRVLVARAMFMFVLALSLATITESIVHRPPDCACLGKALASQEMLRSAEAGLIRNGLLLAGFAAMPGFLGRTRGLESMPPATSAAIARGSAAEQCAGGAGGQVASLGTAARAFTLIEILVSIAVVAVLVGLALVGIGHLRETAAQSRDLSNLKSHVAAMAVYGNSNKEAFPHFIRADGTSQLAGLPAGATYFTQSIYWPILFSDRSAAWVSPGEFFPRVAQYDYDPPDPLAFPYLYTATAVAHPDYWSLETRTGPGQFVTVRFSDCRFPSQKVLLSNTSVRQPERAWAGFVDGSAAGYLRTEFTEPMPTGEGPPPARWSSQAGWPVGSHTLNGMHGRDVLKR